MDCYCFCKSAVFVSIVLLSIVFAVNGITEECTFKDPVSSFIKSSDSKDASSCRNEETLDKDFNINSIRNDWNGPLTSLSCKLRWFSAAETCDLFEKNNGLLFIQSCIHELIVLLIHSIIHSFIHSSIYSLIDGLIHSFIHSIIHSFIHSIIY